MVPLEIAGLRDREAIRKVLHRLSVSFYEEQGKQFDEEIITFKGKFNISYNIPLLDESLTLSVTVAPLHVMERNLWFNFMDFFWSKHADRLNAAWVRTLSILSIQKEDLDQFEQQADDDFEHLQLEIQLNTIYILLFILHLSLSSVFPQIKKQNAPETIVEASISQNTENMIQSSPTTNTIETAKTPQVDATAHEELHPESSNE